MSRRDDLVSSIQPLLHFIQKELFITFASSPVFPKSNKCWSAALFSHFLAISFVLCLFFIIRLTLGLLASNKIVFIKIVFFHIIQKSSSPTKTTRQSKGLASGPSSYIQKARRRHRQPLLPYLQFFSTALFSIMLHYSHLQQVSRLFPA